MITRTEQLVERALIDNEEARKDDFILYYEVVKQIINPEISLKGALLNHSKFGLPSFETVTRCRRKLQERNGALKDTDTAMKRDAMQQDFIDYAMGDKVVY